MARLGAIILLFFSSTAAIAATNDAFASATILEGDAVHSRASFIGTSFEPGEPAPGGYRGSSLWWRWTPPKTASYLVETYKQPWERSPVVAAYRGESLTNLLALTNFAHIGGYSSKLVLRANAAEEIRLQIVDDPFSTSSVDLSIELGPFNDDFQNALPITNSLVYGTTRGATSETGDIPGQNVWYTFNPSFTRPYFFELLAFSWYNDVIIYEGDVRSSLISVGTLHYGSPQAFELAADKKYFFEVRAHKGQSSSFSFSINSGPTNDFFALRHPLLLNETNSASTFRTTREPDEPTHNLTNAQHTIWFEWTAPSTGGFYLEDPFFNYGVEAADFVIYQGTDIATLIAVPSHSAARTTDSGFRRATSFYAVSEEKYYIAFASDRELDFQFALKPSASHDNFYNALPVSLSEEAVFSGVGGTIQPGEQIIRHPRSTFWHNFTAPSNGTYVVLASFAATVYRGTSLENLIIAEPASTNLWPNAFPFRAQAGETVFISINAEYPVPYEIKIVPGKENDNFANRLPLTSITQVEFPEWSTREPGEPLHGTTNYAGTLWWKWTAPESGLHRLGLSLPGYPVALALYTGTNLASLTPADVAENNEYSQSGFAFIDFFATAGTEYAIACGQFSRGFSQLTLAIQKPPPHDNFQSARPLLLGETITDKFLIGTLEPGELAPPDTETLWYSWTAPSSGSFAFTTGIYAEIALFTGSTLTTLTAIPSVPATGGVAFRATAGTEYKFQVSFRASGEVQAFQPAINHGHPNDDLANAADLSGLFLTWTNTLSGATREEPESEDFSRTIWARWTAPQSGEFRIATHDLYTLRLNFDVFSGTDYSNLESIGTSNALGTHFFAHTGSAYLIRIANLSPYPNFFSINLGPALTNAQPSSATQLIGTNISVVADNWTASTLSTGQLSRAIWWRWTAPGNGFVSYQTGPNFVGSVYPYHTRTPTVQSNLHQVFNGFPTSAAITRSNSVIVTKDVTYLFRLDTAPSTNIGFNLVFNEAPSNLGSFSGSLLGGTNFWTAIPSAFTPGKEALSIGPLTNGNYGWIELNVQGPGRLRFKTKIQGSGRLNIATAPLQDTPSQISSPHDWVQRTSLPLIYDTNVVRFTFRQTSTPTTPAKAWIDDIQFIPDPPLRPGIQLYRYSSDYPLQLNLQIQAGRITAVETSTNLVDWIHWTNIYSPRTDYGYQLPIPPDQSSIFFRLRAAD